MTTNIYQVLGNSFSLIDSSGWVVASYDNPEAAAAHADTLNRFNEMAKQIDQAHFNDDLRQALSEKHPLDPQYVPGARYEVKVRELLSQSSAASAEELFEVFRKKVHEQAAAVGRLISCDAEAKPSEAGFYTATIVGTRSALPEYIEFDGENWVGLDALKAANQADYVYWAMGEQPLKSLPPVVNPFAPLRKTAEG